MRLWTTVRASFLKGWQESPDRSRMTSMLVTYLSWWNCYMSIQEVKNRHLCSSIPVNTVICEEGQNGTNGGVDSKVTLPQQWNHLPFEVLTNANGVDGLFEGRVSFTNSTADPQRNKLCCRWVARQANWVNTIWYRSNFDTFVTTNDSHSIDGYKD